MVYLVVAGSKGLLRSARGTALFMVSFLWSVIFASCIISSAQALDLREKENPIRRIVTLLQEMQKEIEAEGEKEEDAFEKFMCYCPHNFNG